jgi:geranylgeranyl diphosphate synthase type I
MEELKDSLKKKRKKGVYSVLKEVDRFVGPKMEELLDSKVEDRFKDIVRYQAATGGKKLRSSLLLLGSLCCGGSAEEAVYPAAGIEILHNNTLMTDDIIDHSFWRRRKYTAWKKYGASITQCLTFIYSASAFQSVHYSRSPKALSDRFAYASKIVLQGEIKDILMEQVGREEEKYVQKNRYSRVSLKDYLEMVSQKTASLIEVAAECGGLCAKATDAQLKALRQYGYNLGVSFQIRDDILDFYGDEAKFGKRIGQDLYERKLGNILLIYALEELGEKEGKGLLDVFKKKNITDGDVNKALTLIKSTRAKEKATELATQYNDQGLESLKNLPKNEYSGILKDFLEFVSVREV